MWRSPFSLQLVKNAAQGWLGQDCALCGAGSGGSMVCIACLHVLPCSFPEKRVVAAFEYRFPVDRLVQRFKFGGDLAIGRWLALQLAQRAASEPRPDLLVPTPLASARLRSRGFNQALEIARVVARRHRLRLEARALARVRDTPPQHLLSRAARRRNLRGAFRCDIPVEGLRVAIVDDVVTTGATADALAGLLLRHGAREVAVWAVARTPAPGGG
jgi:ComF family protein